MNDVRPRHPETMTMAAFVDGALAPDEIAAVAEHLRGCSDCRTVVSETARFEREEAREAPAPSRRFWWLATAAILALAITTVPLLRWSGARNASPIARLIEAAARQHRFVEARLSGFPWAQLQTPPRGEAVPDPADLKMAGAAGEVLEKTADQRQPEARHATGVAYLLISRRNDSMAALEQAAKGSTDPRTWSDLAAARYAVAVQDEHPSQLPLALADADHALRLDPKSAEALFNRALILEHLGIRDQARKAWQVYLAVDAGSAWSVEARAHLRSLESISRRFDPKMLDSAPADQLVREFPQEARTWGEGPMLASWADAEAAGDHAGAAKTLARVHAIADALAAFNGERLLADAVEAIERANQTKRAALVEGQQLYRDARVAYSKRDAGVAEATFTRAAALLRNGASPMALMATYFAASASSDEHQNQQGQTSLGRLLSSIDSHRHRALLAQILGSQAVAANAAGNWGLAVRTGDAAAAAFRSLHETKNAAHADYVAAHAFDMTGAADPAWSRRIRSCAALIDAQDREQLSTLLRSSAETLESFGQSAAAAAMIGLAIDELHGDRAQLVSSLTDRARLADRDGDAVSAATALDEARRAAASVTDATLRQTLDTSIDVAQASSLIGTRPHEAVALLNRAITFISQKDLRDPLPDAYLQRARAFRAAGDDAAALADYTAALSEIDAQRNTINADDLQLRFLDTATQIVDESIELQLSHGSVSAAFAIADRTRELRQRPASQSARTLPLAAGTTVIEYAVLPHATDIFCLSGNRIIVRKVAIERGGLADRIASFGDAIRSRAPLDRIKQDATALFNLLVAPVQAQLSGVDEIVVVPDRQLYAVPFAALYDEAHSQYLAEEVTIRFLPSVSAVRRDEVGALLPALVVADPATPNWPRLPASLREGDRIAAGYGATELSGDSATRGRFVEAATGSALIHYAGHADSDAGNSYSSLLLASADGNSGVLASNDIALLNLSKHPLVVLAACGTFGGNAVHVGGMSGLTRAFLLAGARAVAGTLWEVEDDVAAAFFLKFHEHLRAGSSPARAVRTTQIEMIHASDPRLRHPATWAPVELMSSF